MRFQTKLVAVLACMFLGGVSPTLAQQKGQWVPGQFGLNAGAIPDAGFTYADLPLNYVNGGLVANITGTNLNTRGGGSGFADAQSTSGPGTPQAKQADANDGWHVEVTPYLWFAGVHGTTGALGREASVDASFSDIFKYFNIGAMGVLEARYNRIIMPLDFMWMKLSDDKGLPLNELGVQSIKAKMTETMLTPKIGYRVADGKRVKIDALFGIRYWHVSTEFTLEPQLANGFSQSVNWVDAVGGGRIQVALSQKAFVVIGGDAGGGSARHDYQVGGFLGYKISRRWVLLGGYRYLSVNYRPTGNDQFVYDVDMPGLVFGATFSIK